MSKENVMRSVVEDYSMGKLYRQLKSGIKEELIVHIPTEEEKKKPSFLYDSKTGNVHYFAEDKLIAKNCADDISSKRDELKSEIEEKLKEKNGWSLTRKGSASVWPAFNETEYSNKSGVKYGGIFRYIHITVGEDKNNLRNYTMMFIRFCKNKEDKTIDCILKSPQFIACRARVKSIDIYPNTLENDKRSASENLCRKRDSKKFIEDKFAHYYNPTVSFYDDNDKICNTFLDFIDANEKELVEQ